LIDTSSRVLSLFVTFCVTHSEHNVNSSHTNPSTMSIVSDNVSIGEAECAGRRPRTLVDGHSRRHRFEQLIEARWLHAVVMATIIANAVTLWPMTDEPKRPGVVDDARRAERQVYFYLNVIFVIVYLIEFLLKVNYVYTWLLTSGICFIHQQVIIFSGTVRRSRCVLLILKFTNY